MRTFIWVVICLSGLFPTIVCGQTSEGFLSADSLRVETGNNYVVRLVLAGEEQVFPAENVEFRYGKHTFLQENVLFVSRWEKGDDQWVKEVHLIYFDSGTYIFPPVRIPFAMAEGKSASVTTDSLTIEVYDSVVLDMQPTPIKDIHAAPPSMLKYLIPALLVLFILGLGYAAYRYLKHKQSLQKSKVRSSSVAMPPKELALKRIAALKAKLPLPDAEINPFYTELSALLREYFEHRYDMPALEMTSGEILEKIKDESFPSDLLPILHRLFVHCDMVKFAKGVPPKEYHLEALEDAGWCIL